VTIQAAEEDGKVEIEIIDNGLGMAGDALAQANESLKNGGEVTIDTARRMGLFVVSRLAEEHGLKVKLRRNTNGGGIIASITLPAAVLVSESAVEHVSVLDATEELEEPAAPVVEDEPEEEYDPYLERIEEAIAAVTGLPRRRPGQAPGPAAQAPAASVGMFEASPNPELPPGFEPTELPSMEEHDDVPDAETAPAISSVSALDSEYWEDAESLAPVVTPAFGAERNEATAQAEESGEHDDPDHSEHVADAGTEDSELVETDEHDEHDEPVAAAPWAGAQQDWGSAAAESLDDAAQTAEVETASGTTHEAPEPVVARADDSSVEEDESPVSDSPVRLQIRRPLSASPAASALEGDFVAEQEVPEDSTIFGQLRSNWLNDDEHDEHAWVAGEVDRGWNAAERADSASAEDTTRTGLPVRRPGGRLVPGSVSEEEPSKVVRDPEAIRNRLAAHAAGVSRGRAAAAAQPSTFDYTHEENGPA
jgi:hypothetical protein